MKFNKEPLNLVSFWIYQINEGQVDRLLATFGRFCISSMKPLHDQFSEKNVSGSAKTLTGDALSLKILYECLMEEPITT